MNTCEIAEMMNMNVKFFASSSAVIETKTIDTTARSVSYAPSPPLAGQDYSALSAPKAFTTRTALKHLIKNWTSSQKPRNPRVSTALTRKDSFSPAFETAIGIVNVTDVHGLEDERILEAVFEELLEHEATQQFRSGNNYNLEALLNIHKDLYCGGMEVSGKIAMNGKSHWSINHGKIEGIAWVDLLCAIFNLSRLDALATLANILHMRFENLYQLSSDVHTAEANGEPFKSEEVPQEIHLPRLPAGSACAELVEKVDIIGNAGQVIGAVTMYRLNGNDFCLPATVGRGVLSLGKYKPVAYFLNQYLMDKYPCATILLCQDMRSALALQRTLDETRGCNPAEIIVTGHLGDDLSVLPWNYLHSHDVVFVPAPTKTCMAMTKLYRDYIGGAKAKNFKVSKSFLLHFPTGSDLRGKVEGVTEAEAELLRSAVVLEDVERPLWLIQRIVRDSVSYDEFKAWGQRLDIFKVPKEQTSKAAAGTTDLVLFNPTSVPAARQSASLTDVTTSRILPHGGFVLLHGLKDSGKSMVSLATTKTITTGRKLFGVIPADGSGNILYVDSETPQDVLMERLNQLGLVEEVGKHLFLLSKFDHASAYSFSLTDQSFLDAVKTALRKCDCRYLVLDNLTSLMEGGRLYQSAGLSAFFKWIEDLQRQDICVLVVHHTQEDSNAGTATAKARGSQEFAIRAHTEIVLVGSAEILEKKLGTETVQAAAAQDGLTLGICFKVCKSASVLQKKFFWLHLPLGASEWQTLAVTGADGKLIDVGFDAEHDIPVDISHSSKAEQSTGSTAEIFSEPLSDEGPGAIANNLELPPNCTDEQISLYKYIMEHDSVKNADVRALLNCAETKASSILNSLVDMGIVRRVGQGRTTSYRPTRKS